jgi:hypothetical protein
MSNNSQAPKEQFSVDVFRAKLFKLQDASLEVQKYLAQHTDKPGVKEVLDAFHMSVLNMIDIVDENLPNCSLDIVVVAPLNNNR